MHSAQAYKRLSLETAKNVMVLAIEPMTADDNDHTY